MTPITTATEVARTPDEVFDYVTDPARFPEWQQGVVDAHTTGDGPAVAGVNCVTTRRIGGVQRTVTAVITHVDPPRSWGVSGTDGPIRAAVDVTVTALDGGSRSRVEIAVDFTGHGVGKVLVPLMVRPSARREMPANLARLKQRLEGGA